MQQPLEPELQVQPQVNLEELVCLYDKDAFTRVECAGAREVFRLRDTLLPMVRLKEALAREKMFDEDARIFVKHFFPGKRFF
ncbi:hypothetical protein R83H12_02697 [Fibrobacteria bacterium R8-3-H12]